MMSSRSAVKQAIDRRTWLGGTAAAVAGFALPVTSHAASQQGSSQVLRAHIGVGNRGKDHLKQPGPIAAICDVDRRRLERRRAEVISDRSGQQSCEAYEDFRRVLDRSDIDAVVVCSPDHWHALMVIGACEAGKHVFVEKPLSLTFAEGRKMVAAAEQNKCTVQVGSQQRSDFRFAFAAELVQSGRLGQIRKIEVGLPGVGIRPDPVPDAQPPDWLNYELWLGPAPYRPYNARRIHMPWREWRWWWDYSGGNMTNWGAHHLDVAQWALGEDRSGPVEIDGSGVFDPDGRFSVPAQYRVRYRYASGVVVEAASDGLKQGVTFLGSAGKLHVDRGTITSDPEELLDVELEHGRLRDYEERYRSRDHFREWLDCIVLGGTPSADIETGHRTATTCHLGNISIRLNRPIRWDPVHECVLQDREATAMLERDYRKAWQAGG